MFGCLLAGFYLLRVYDMTTATLSPRPSTWRWRWSAWRWRRRTPRRRASRAGRTPPPAQRPPAACWPVYVAIALSGAAALGAEVVWTRLLGLMLGATVYTFSIILAVFLVGLGIGSAAGAIGALSARALRPRAALGWCQLLLAGGIAWTAFMLADSLPYWPVNPLLSTKPVVHLPDRSGARALGDAAGDAAVGRELSPGAGGRGAAAAKIPGRWWARVYAANTVRRHRWARWPSA